MLELPTCMQCTDQGTIFKQFYSFLHITEWLLGPSKARYSTLGISNI
jgi:hypothetical protein